MTILYKHSKFIMTNIINDHHDYLIEILYIKHIS